MTKVYGVYHQYRPDWKYEPSMKSIWSTEELAQVEVDRLKKLNPDDDVWIVELNVDEQDSVPY